MVATTILKAIFAGLVWFVIWSEVDPVKEPKKGKVGVDYEVCRASSYHLRGSSKTVYIARELKFSKVIWESLKILAIFGVPTVLYVFGAVGKLTVEKAQRFIDAMLPYLWFWTKTTLLAGFPAIILTRTDAFFRWVEKSYVNNPLAWILLNDFTIALLGGIVSALAF